MIATFVQNADDPYVWQPVRHPRDGQHQNVLAVRVDGQISTGVRCICTDCWRTWYDSYDPPPCQRVDP